jgi:hypothetical protein
LAEPVIGSAHSGGDADQRIQQHIHDPAFWERLWCMSGINFVAFFVVAFDTYGNQPQVGASSDALVVFYAGERTRILIAAVLSGMAVPNLLWFAAAII